MITINNYQELKNSINWSELPKQIRENRDEVESIMEFYDDDNDIKEAVDLFFKGINDNISKKSEPKTKPISKVIALSKGDKLKFTASKRLLIDDGTQSTYRTVIEDRDYFYRGIEQYEDNLIGKHKIADSLGSTFYISDSELHEYIEKGVVVLLKNQTDNQKKSDIPKTLAAFKNWAKENIGHVLYLVGKYGDRIDHVTREVEVPQTNAIGFKTERNTTSWIQFGKSSEWEFTDKYAKWTEPSGYTVLTYYYDKPKNWGEETTKQKEETIRETLQNTKYVKLVMPKLQQQVLLEYERSEEKEHFIDLIKDLEKVFDEARKRQDLNLMKSIVKAHYFYGATDWYILDYDPKENLFFGYVVLNGDTQNSEAGYISIDELQTIKGIELDFYFDQKPLGKILNSKYPGEFDEYEEEPKQKVEKTKASSTKKSKVKKVVSEKQLVDNNSIEFLLIRRFYNILKKGDEAVIPFNTIRLLYTAFNKAAVERKVRKTSEYADLFNKCNEKVSILFEEFANPNKQDVKIEFTDKKLYQEIEDFSTNKKVNPSVSLLKRFIGMQGTLPEVKKAKSLLKSISNQLENSNDRLKPELTAAKKELETYLYNPKEKVEVYHYGLSVPRNICTNRIKCTGIDKTGKLKKGYKFQKHTGAVIRVKKKSLNSPFESSYPIETVIMPNPIYNSIEFSKTEQKQPEAQIFVPSIENSIEDVNEVVEKKVVEKPIKTNEKMPSGAKRLLSTNFDVLQINEEWSELMQNPAANLKIAIWGKPKNGKTSASLQMAEYFTNFGMVLYNFADQGFNLSTKQLWIDSGLANNSNAEPSDISTTQELEKEIATGKYKFVFIDMISDYIRKEKLRPEEFKERFIKRFPDVSFILIFEVTKTGDFKGDQGWTHVVDAIMTVENFFMENRGRYGMGERIIWEEGFQRFNPKKYDEYILEKQQKEMQNAPSETIKI